MLEKMMNESWVTTPAMRCAELVWAVLEAHGYHLRYKVKPTPQQCDEAVRLMSKLVGQDATEMLHGAITGGLRSAGEAAHLNWCIEEVLRKEI